MLSNCNIKITYVNVHICTHMYVYLETLIVSIYKHEDVKIKSKLYDEKFKLEYKKNKISYIKCITINKCCDNYSFY